MCEDMKIPPYKNKSQFIVPLSGEIFAVCAEATERKFAEKRRFKGSI